MPPPTWKSKTERSLHPSNWTSDDLRYLGILTSPLPSTATPGLDSPVIEIPGQKPHPVHDLLRRYTLQQKLNTHEASKLWEFLDSLPLIVVEISYLFPLSTNTAPNECQLQIGGAEYLFTPVASAGIKLFFTRSRGGIRRGRELEVDAACCIAFAQQNMDLEKPRKEYFEFIVVSMHFSQVRIIRVAFTRSMVHWVQNSNVPDVRDWFLATEKGGSGGERVGWDDGGVGGI